MAAVAATLWDVPQHLAHPRDLPQHLASSGEACAHTPPILSHHWDASCGHAAPTLNSPADAPCGHAPPPLASARGDVSSNHASQPLAFPGDAPCGHALLPRLPLTATDGNACCGGTALALLGAFERVKAVELDEDRCADLVHNLRVLGYAPTPALPGDPDCVPVPGLFEKEEGAAAAGLAELQEGVVVPGFDEKEEGAAVAGLVQGMECVAEARGRGAREVQVRGRLWGGAVRCSFKAGRRGALGVQARGAATSLRRGPLTCCPAATAPLLLLPYHLN